jgi:hypothetical protein
LLNYLGFRAYCGARNGSSLSVCRNGRSQGCGSDRPAGTSDSVFKHSFSVCYVNTRAS